MLAKILLTWGATIMALFYVAGSLVAAADAYAKGGVAGLVVALALLSAVPSLVLGVILADR